MALLLRLTLVFLDGDVLDRNLSARGHITLFIEADNVHSLLSSIMYSGYAWIRSNVITS